MTSPASDCVRQPAKDSSTEGLSVEELARRAQSGDAAAFTALAQNLRPRLLVVLQKRMQGHDDIEDIAQDTFAKVWSNIRSYDPDRSFVAWVYTIALRRATDYLRGNRRRRKLTQSFPENEATSAKASSRVIERDAAENVWRVARQVLSASQYTALWLRYGEELPLNEIAAATGKTQVATRVLLHRARAMLRRELSSRGECYD